MKLKASLLAALAAFASPVFAGSQVASPVAAPAQSFGLGWYGAFDGGVNAYQSYGNSQSFTLGGFQPDDLGGSGGGTAFQTITLHRQNKIGGFGGLKLGYVFGRGTVRFAIEEDVFYNGFQSSLQATSNFGPQVATFNTRVNSVAFMTNFLIRFSLGSGRFQPYLGGGIGGFYASTGNPSVSFGNVTQSFNGSSSGGGFAWQLVGGTDYYFTRTVSMFLEYKYLNYNHLNGVGSINVFSSPVTTPTVSFGPTDVRQSLVGAGVRFHF